MLPRRCAGAMIVGGHGRGGGKLFCSFALFATLLVAGASAKNSSPSSSSWKTLTGKSPVIVAHGGFSGIFPDSSLAAYNFAIESTTPDTILWCDVQLTKDGAGICLPDLLLDNFTNIGQNYPNKIRSYDVNDVMTTGHFSLDLDSRDLQSVGLVQSNFARTFLFDGTFSIVKVDELRLNVTFNMLWLNIEHDIFYRQHNLSMVSYVTSLTKHTAVNYISSPELGFLRSLPVRIKRRTKLVFRFLDMHNVEPSTNQTYGSLLHNLTFIKVHASGILVPKTYIWPITPDDYTLASTSLVQDAHEAGLEIYAAGFANDKIDNFISYNYSYDPIAEYLAFIDNGAFSVDGVITDFPITASEAISCFSKLNTSATDHGRPLIISHNGDSGDYPDCTDLAYNSAISGGADFIDCTVQITQDGIPICMSSISLFDDTTVAHSLLSSRISTIPEIQSAAGIFTFNVTWLEIQTILKPMISSPESVFVMNRNPRFKNSGSYLKLSDFLALGKDQDVFGICIIIQNAAFMVEKLGFDVVRAVMVSIRDAGYSSQAAPEVIIQSPESAVLVRFKQQTGYKLSYVIREDISDVDASSLADIRSFADAVVVTTRSIYPTSKDFITGQTNTTHRFQSANISVYVTVLRNEFVSQPWDFFSDATKQIIEYVQGDGVDGIITDFPATARRYKRNSCRNLGGAFMPNAMETVQPGGLLGVIPQGSQPPVLSPQPALNASDVEEEPLPSIDSASAPSPEIAPMPTTATRSDGVKAGQPVAVLLVAFCASLLI